MLVLDLADSASLHDMRGKNVRSEVVGDNLAMLCSLGLGVALRRAVAEMPALSTAARLVGRAGRECMETSARVACTVTLLSPRVGLTTLSTL